ncbi:MAG: hypothetical protein FWF49_02110 [Oscillospiraceae bacterium]|nr:hypothetical protein [Oscillospiraceae bacterium]
MLADKMAADNPDTEAFYRFADFENYYPHRIQVDTYLYELFVSLGGKPKEKHPLSFVLQGSTYLDSWFSHGNISKIRLKNIPPDSISFTYGDSGATLKRDGKLTMQTKEMLFIAMGNYTGTSDGFMKEIEEKHGYIEVQLWDDDYCHPE